ncbi:MAG: hypothetical protein JO270_04170 [Acidobacteriaceae bacterium]|nr:hypothetical protein [Acidobacteriaceae bacterium]
MPSVTEHLQVAPLYVRWPAERAPFAIELRLDLVSRLCLEIERGAQQGMEIGGVMLGRILDGPTPTLRVETVEMIRRRPEDGSVFLLNPDQLNTFKEICEAARLGARTVIGLFRSQLRSDRLRPSAADRSLASEQFGLDPYALLLVQGRAPHSAAFFASGGKDLPAEPAVSEFVLDESALKSLPEAPAPDSVRATRPLAQPPSAARSVWLLGALALVFAALFIWLVARDRLKTSVRPPNPIELAIAPDGAIVRITWNHAARDIVHARGATMLILDGSQRVEVPLTPDDLRYGSIDYQRRTNDVGITVTLDTPVTGAPVSAHWKSF